MGRIKGRIIQSEVLDGVDDDIGTLPYMVTVTTTKPITPLFLPDPVVLFTIRLVPYGWFPKAFSGNDDSVPLPWTLASSL